MNEFSERLHSSLWPIPLLMLLLSIPLVGATLAADARWAGSDALARSWFYSGSGSDARNLLSTLSSAIITISSIVFSITIVALSLAANQFGSRLVRAYMRDLRTKLSLGFFLLTVVFSLLALRLVTEDMPPEKVPHVTVSTGLALSVACVLMLVYFLHVVARSIIVDEVIRRVVAELDHTIDRLPPLEGPEKPVPGDAELLPADFESNSELLRSAKEGYVQVIHYEKLAAYASRADVRLRLDVAAGSYVTKHGWIGRVYPASRCSQELLLAVRRAVVIGPERTPAQDLAFSARHLVDVGLRALSPAINDANTAFVVIDRLRGALARLLAKSLPTGIFFDAAGECRLIGRRRNHAEVVAGALRPLRDAAASQPLVIVAMLQALAQLAEHVQARSQFDFIREEGRLIEEVGLAHPQPESERSAIRAARAALERRLAELAD